MTTNDLHKTAGQAIQRLRGLALAGDIEAITALRDLSLHAAEILRGMTSQAASTDLPDNYVQAGENALQLAKESRVWPVAFHSIQEIRNVDFSQVEKLEIGSATGIRLSGKRGLSYMKPTGFAYDIFLELDAIRRDPADYRHPVETCPELAGDGVLTPAWNYRTWKHLAAELKPLSRDSVKQWEEAGVEYCRDLCRAKPEPSQWRHQLGENGLGILPEDIFADWSEFPWPDCVANKSGTATDGNGHLRTIESAVRSKISEGLNQLISQSRPRK